MIKLSLSLFPWASFRRRKGAIKLHILLDHSGYLPAFVAVSEGKTHETKIARALSLPVGSIVAIDRGYVDYSWLDNLSGEAFSLSRASTATAPIVLLNAAR